MLYREIVETEKSFADNSCSHPTQERFPWPEAGPSQPSPFLQPPKARCPMLQSPIPGNGFLVWQQHASSTRHANLLRGVLAADP